MGSTRYVDIKLTQGKQLENFYWVEGTLAFDKGCRITVLHTGQERQCSHCLRRVNCPTEGNGKACQSLNTPRGRISDYMRYLKESHNYISLKMKYRDKLEQEFPALGKKNLEDDGFSHMTEDLEDKDNELEENFVENSLTVNPDDFEYDEDTDLLKPKDQVAFDELLDKHPSVNKLKRDNKREQKIANLNLAGAKLGSALAWLRQSF